MTNPLCEARKPGEVPYWCQPRDLEIESEHLRMMQEMERAVKAAAELRAKPQTEKGI